MNSPTQSAWGFSVAPKRLDDIVTCLRGQGGVHLSLLGFGLSAQSVLHGTLLLLAASNLLLVRQFVVAPTEDPLEEQDEPAQYQPADQSEDDTCHRPYGRSLRPILWLERDIPEVATGVV